MRFIKQSRHSKVVVGLLILIILDAGWISPAYSMQTIIERIPLHSVVNMAHSVGLALACCQTQLRSSLSTCFRQFNRKIDVATAAKNVTPTAPQTSSTLPQVATRTQQAIVDTAKNQPPVQPPASSKTNAKTVVLPAVDRKVVAAPAIQTIYESLPQVDKETAQKIINNISVDQHIDWHKETAQDSSRAHARYVDQIIMKAQNEQNTHIRRTVHSAGITWEADIGKGTAYAGINLRPHEITYAERCARHEARWANTSLNNLFRLQEYQNLNNVELRQATDVLAYGKMVLEGDILDRITALLSILEMRASQKESSALSDLQQSLYATYFHTDQTLCAQALTHGCNAQEFFTHYQDRVNNKFERTFDSFNPDAHVNQQVACNLLIKKSLLFTKESQVPAHFTDTVHTNEINTLILEITRALLSGDIATAKQINEQSKNNNVGRIFSAGYKDWQTRVEKQKQKIEATRKDSFGIYHFNLPSSQQDPVFTALSVQEKIVLQNNTRDLKELNKYLSLRQSIKLKLHEAWGIPHSVPAEVHDALYAMFENNAFAQITTVIEKAHEVSTNPALTPQQQQNIVNALFHPNGIIKELQQDKRTQSFKASSAIMSVEHANTRTLLNQLALLEAEHKNKDLKECARYGLKYLQAALMAPNQSIAKQYLCFADDLYNGILENRMASVGIFADFACTYANAQQLALHQDLMNAVAVLVPLRNHELISGKNSLFDSAFAYSMSLVDLRETFAIVHELNQKGEIISGKKAFIESISSLKKHAHALPTQDFKNIIDEIVARYELDIKQHEKEYKQCGTAQLHEDSPFPIGECSPRFNVDDGIVKSHCSPELDTLKDEKSCGIPERNDEKNPEKAPQCGHAGQTLPGFGSDGDARDESKTGNDEPADDMAKGDKPAGIKIIRGDAGVVSDTAPTDDPDPSDEAHEPEASTLDEIVQNLDNRIRFLPAETIKANADQLAQEIAPDPQKITAGSENAVDNTAKNKSGESESEFIKALEKILRQDKSLTPEQKVILDAVIKERKHRQSRKRCKRHEEITEKGWHQLARSEKFDSVIATPEQWEKLVKRFDGTPIVISIDGADVRLVVRIDYEHLGPVMKIHCETGQLDLAGFHHDYQGKAQKSGLFDFEIVTERNEHGVYEARWSYGNAEKKPSTFFPDHWPQEKVIEKIYEALHNITKKNKVNGVRWELQGETNEGIAIRIILDIAPSRTGKSIGEIVTAHPLLERQL